MYDPRIAKWADVLTQYSAPVAPGNQVVIYGSPPAEALILELARAVVERDAFPLIRMEPSDLDEVIFRHATESVLDGVPKLAETEMEQLDIIYRVRAATNTRALNNVEPARIVRRQRANQALSQIQLTRALAGDLFWCSTQYPTSAYARDAEMSLHDYSEFVFAACFLNDKDPIHRWQQQDARQQVLTDHLNRSQEVHIIAPGTDLRLNVKDRIWVNCSGQNNFPCGEVSTGPVEDQVEGYITFNFPGLYGGREVRDIQLWFEQGRVVKAAAQHNEDLLQTVLDTDEGARYLGELAFGTNYSIQRFSRNILFDEKMGGTIHLALGRSYPSTGGKNLSSIHWDIICDLRQDSEVYVDGELYQKNGHFQALDGGIV